MKNWLVDVPVRVQVWNRPDCQKKQCEILKKARPSILFLISDGGRTPEEMAKIEESRKIMDEGIDWECTVHRLYMNENQGMYAMSKRASELIWSTVDRCIFLEDDYVPAVSFFRYCAELLEKYKDDERIEMITGFNHAGVYEDALPNDYFFVEAGWAIWGTAYWRRTVNNYTYPLPYAKDEYIRARLKEDLSPFDYSIAEKYMNGELAGNHVPGGEYFHAVNSVLYHRLSIVPTKNMICNVGNDGAHAQTSRVYAKRDAKLFGTPTYEIEGEIKHPEYVIDDRNYTDIAYEVLLRGDKYKYKRLWLKIRRAFELMFSGKLLAKVKKVINRKNTIEK